MDEVLAITGIDAIFTGQQDLSWSMGRKGAFDSPDFEAAGQTVAEACKKYGIPWGLPQADADSFFDDTIKAHDYCLSARTGVLYKAELHSLLKASKRDWRNWFEEGVTVF